jgi:predicted ArsR family transcriptional regulator
VSVKKLCKYIFTKFSKFGIISEMPATARQRVLRYLGQYAGASAAQIARGLGMKAPAVRHHLSVLRADGRVMTGRGSVQSGPGRRPLSYRISERLRGHNLALVAEVLLTGWPSALRSRTDRIVQILSKGLVDRIGPLDAKAGASGRLAQLVSALNVLHYQARWEAAAAGPRILFGHCPYAAIINTHPELCLMDSRVVSDIMGAQVQQTAKIDFKGGTATHCVLMLKESPGYQRTASSKQAK